ncbi:MAG: prolipoprotein diacylglyceryl transferase family protein [Acidimicrobiia bacterium]
MEFTLLGAVAIAVGLMYATLWFEGGRTNAADCTRDVWDALITGAMAGLVVGRLVAMGRGGVNPVTNPGDILIVRAGVDTIAATVTALVGFGFMVRRDLWWMADSAAPAAVAGLAGWHAGCLVRDACLGTPSDLPFAVAQTGSNITRHPVEIYAALLLLGVAVLLIAWKRSRPAAGVVASVAALAIAVVRMATEPMRPVLGPSLITWYGAAAVLAAAVLAWRVRSVRCAGGT